ncbi:DNA repair protein RecO [Mariluticola halotolerans]|uniref:DNA repair protein RecO n=1 Tax=Mariluticola halotolerans TaxID=2909283 RepID=UPI0026E21CC4|nr:DNA repair protein RecO [Mariluticola halotolerans]UJQ95663.1 DNA repair protein RecO [Mariluticola halotolerans]
MEWTGHGLIIGVRRHGESSVIVEAMVARRGRYMGLVRGGRSTRHAATLQPGNDVQLTWRARLENHLGNFSVELVHPRAAELIADQIRLYACQLLCDHLRLLPERDPHDRLMGAAIDILDGEGDSLVLGAALARFEFFLLDELGFGLDIFSCALTGETTNLTHVSPKTGRAVTRTAAEPYIEKLLPLPTFLQGDVTPGLGDISNAFRLTGHFLAMHVWTARQIAPPTTRDRLIGMLTKPL